MRTTSRNLSAVRKVCCTAGETSANAPCASSRRKASICRLMTVRISATSALVTRFSAAGARPDAATARNIRTVLSIGHLPECLDGRAGGEPGLSPARESSVASRLLPVGAALRPESSPGDSGSLRGSLISPLKRDEKISAKTTTDSRKREDHSMKIVALVLAGGEGSRLYPLTAEHAK